MILYVVVVLYFNFTNSHTKKQLFFNLLPIGIDGKERVIQKIAKNRDRGQMAFFRENFRTHVAPTKFYDK